MSDISPAPCPYHDGEVCDLTGTRCKAEGYVFGSEKAIERNCRRRRDHDDTMEMVRNGKARTEAAEAEVKRQASEIARLTIRIDDLKFALGDKGGWFDRAMAAERKVVGLTDEVVRLWTVIDLVWDPSEDPELPDNCITAVLAAYLSHDLPALERALGIGTNEGSVKP